MAVLLGTKRRNKISLFVFSQNILGDLIYFENVFFRAQNQPHFIKNLKIRWKNQENHGKKKLPSSSHFFDFFFGFCQKLVQSVHKRPKIGLGTGI